MSRLERVKETKEIKAYFEVKSALDIPISTTKNYWHIITHIKHPSIYRKEKEVRKTLVNPDEIRVSKKASDVFLFYKKFTKFYLCVVAKTLKKRGFIITAYWTDKIKEGRLRWKK